MLSNKTQDCLCDLLFEIAKGEKQVEAIRQSLGEQAPFESYSAFRRIDQSKKRFIVASDVREFLLMNGFPRSLAECESFIASYDLDSDNKMSYTEFLRAVLSYDDQELREMVSQRPPVEIKQGEKLNSEVEYTLSKLIDKEVENVHSLNEKKEALFVRFDFDCADCFDAIDGNRKRFLDGRDFYEYFRKNSLVSYEDEIKALTRRMDFDQDGRISFKDFSRVLSNNPQAQQQQPLAQQNRERTPSSLKQTGSANEQSLSFQQKTSSTLMMSPTSQTSFQKQSNTSLSNNYDSASIETTISRRRGSNFNLRNVQIVSPSNRSVYPNATIDASRQSPSASSSLCSSNGFKHSPAGKSILKNSSKKHQFYEQEKNTIRFELNESKKSDCHQQKAVNFNESQNSRIIVSCEKQQSQSFVEESIGQKEHDKLIERMRDLRKQETQSILERQIAKKSESFLVSARPQLNSDIRQRTPIKDKQGSLQQQQPTSIITPQNEVPLKSYDTSMHASRKTSIHNYDQIRNQGNGPQIIVHEQSFQQKNPQHQSALSRAEQRLIELGEEKRIQQLENKRFQQESEAKERRIQQEESNIRKQIEYELYLKQRVQQVNRSSSIDNTSSGLLNQSNKSNNNTTNTNLLKLIPTTVTPKQSLTSPSQSQARNGSTPNKLTLSNVNYHSQQQTVGTTKPAQTSPSCYTSPIDLEYTLKRSKTKDQFSNGDHSKNDETLPLWSQKEASSRSFSANNSSGDYINKVVRQFQELIAVEKKSERSLQDLSLRPDFKLGDLFKILDRSQRGVISRSLLEDFFKKIDLDLNTTDLFLYMRRYDNDNDGKLTFANVAESLTPRQKEYAKLLNKRESYLQGEIIIEEVYSFETLRLLKDSFRTLINAEKIIEGIRGEWKLQRRSDALETVFSHIDADQDGFLSSKDIFFEKNSVFCSEKEVSLLIGKFDHDCDGMISLGEFVEELSQKLPLY